MWQPQAADLRYSRHPVGILSPENPLLHQREEPPTDDDQKFQT